MKKNVIVTKTLIKAKKAPKPKPRTKWSTVLKAQTGYQSPQFQPVRNNPTPNSYYKTKDVPGGKQMSFGEYLGTVRSDGAPGVPGQALYNLDINPNYWEGTRLQQESRAWESFRFDELNFHWCPAVGADVNGTIGMAYDHDPSDATPPTGDAGIHMYDSYEDRMPTSVSLPATLVCHPRDGSQRYFLNETAGGDARLVYQGQVYVFNRVPSGQAAGFPLGTIEVSGKITFFTPQLEQVDSSVVLENTDQTSPYLPTGGIGNGNTNGSAPITTVAPIGNVTGVASPGFVVAAQGVQPVLKPSIYSLGNPAATPAIVPGQQVFLREGNYRVDVDGTLYNSASSGQTLSVSNPVLNNKEGTAALPAPGPSAIPGANNNPVIQTLGGYVARLAWGTTFLSAANAAILPFASYLVSVPPGGAFLDGMQIQTQGSAGTAYSAALVNAALFITSISLRQALMYVQIYLNGEINPKPRLPKLKAQLEAKPLDVKSIPQEMTLLATAALEATYDRVKNDPTMSTAFKADLRQELQRRGVPLP
jgi:hypothetical protein